MHVGWLSVYGYCVWKSENCVLMVWKLCAEMKTPCCWDKITSIRGKQKSLKKMKEVIQLKVTFYQNGSYFLVKIGYFQKQKYFLWSKLQCTNMMTSLEYILASTSHITTVTSNFFRWNGLKRQPSILLENMIWQQSQVNHTNL